MMSVNKYVHLYNLKSLYIILLFLLCISYRGYGQETYSINNYASWDTGTIMSVIRSADSMANSKPDSAMYYYRQVIHFSGKTGYMDGLALGWYNMGHLEINRSRHNAALLYFEKAFPYAKAAKHTKHLTTGIYGNIGTIHFFHGNYKRAAKYYDSALKEGLKVELHDRGKFFANTLNNLGIVHIRLNQYPSALEYLNRAEDVCRRNNLIRPLFNVLSNKMGLYIQTEDYSKAMACYDEAMKMARGHRLREQEMILLCSISEMMLKQNKPEEAIHYLRNTDFHIPDVNDYYFKIFPGYILGKAFKQLKQFDKAEYYFSTALDMAIEKGIHDGRREAHQMLAEIYEATNQYDKALKQQKLYQQLSDSLFSREKVRDINELEVKYRSAEKDKQLLQERAQRQQKEARLREKNLWMIGIALAALLMGIIFVFIYRNIRHRQTVALKNGEMKRLQAFIEGEEKERSRIARELHDGIGGMLASAKMNLSAIDSALLPATEQQQMKHVNQILDDTTAEVRRTAHNLLPDILTKYDLEKALSIYIERINAGGQLAVRLQCHGLEGKLNKATELMLYRITQELIQNIVKHAHATRAAVQVMLIDDILGIIVEDNGHGFNMENQGSGQGLDSLRFRVKSLQGNMDIFSQQGKGTTVHIQFDWNAIVNEP